MKIQITVSADQLELIRLSMVHSSLRDSLLNKKDPAWIDLYLIVEQADNQVNKGIPVTASYRVIK